MIPRFVFVATLFLYVSFGTSAQTNPRDTLMQNLQQRLTPGEWEYLKDHMSTKSGWEIAALIIPWVTTLSAIIGFFLQQRWHKQRETRTILFEGLKWFEGDTQKRSIGIALIEANWSDDEKLHDAWRAVLSNQAIYLIGKSKQQDSPHEIDNLERIMEIILTRKLVSERQVQAVHDMVSEKLKREGDVPGLYLKANMQLLKYWEAALDKMGKDIKKPADAPSAGFQN